jgi:type I restriction enzyme S subunit
VEGELTREWREAHRDELEPASILLERLLNERRARWEEEQLAKMRAKGKEPKDDRWKAKYQEPTRLDKDDLPKLPEGWVWTYIQPLLETERDGMKTGPFGSILKNA